MLIPPSRRKQSRIPLISLIDMTFMLFIFFILITRFTNFDQVELNVGDTKVVAAAGDAPDILYLRLNPDSVQLGASYIPYASIGKVVKPYLPNHSVIIETGEGATVQQMVSVLDAVKLAGASDITLREIP